MNEKQERLQASLENLIETHAETMSYDNPENHWWYADHLESLADDIKTLYKSFYEIRVIDGDPK
jgi:hypothetical protein